MYEIAIPANIQALIDAHAPIAVGVSGGKDSDAAAIAVFRELDRQGHTGDRILVHCDLGRIEWRDSQPQCERLAVFLGCELVVVRREAGDMLDRWETRWRNNMARYRALTCVRTILPWSTPGMRFCTSELKSAPLSRALIKRWPGQEIISVVGLRAEESASRAKVPESRPQNRLTHKTTGTTGFDWHPILGWSRDEVISYHDFVGFPLHTGYTRYDMSRISCTYCIMSTAADLTAAATCVDNQPVYRNLVDLEILSTFGFQSNRWLADIAPHVLSAEQRAAVVDAKCRAELRVQAESTIPRHLLFTKGHATAIPTFIEAQGIAAVRRTVADLLSISVDYTEPLQIQARYRELHV